jgi:hypothetical protein
MKKTNQYRILDYVEHDLLVLRVAVVGIREQRTELLVGAQLELANLSKASAILNDVDKYLDSIITYN